MKIAIISDIHGNYEALLAVLQDIDTQDTDEIINLGDFINYGPESEKVSIKIQESSIQTTLGNHEAIFNDRSGLNSFNFHSVESFKITEKLLTKKSINFIKTLPDILVKHNLRFVHGLPPDNIFDYISMQSNQKLNYIFQSFPESICFIGHTHLLGLYCYKGNNIKIKTLAPDQTIKLKSKTKYIINCGSVGQPRSMNKNAQYVIFDTETKILEAKQSEYDVLKTINLLQEMGFPKLNSSILTSSDL